MGRRYIDACVGEVAFRNVLVETIAFTMTRARHFPVKNVGERPNRKHRQSAPARQKKRRKQLNRAMKSCSMKNLAISASH